MNRIIPEVGKTYINHNGFDYICRSIGGDGSAVMEQVKGGWTLTAHGICQYEDGTIEWDYSTGGHWTRSELEIVEQFAKKQGNGNFACPRCGRMAMDKNPARNALSRRATVYVCDRCGMAEALEDMLGNIRIALMDWALVQHPEFWNMDN